MNSLRGFVLKNGSPHELIVSTVDVRVNWLDGSIEFRRNSRATLSPQVSIIDELYYNQVRIEVSIADNPTAKAVIEYENRPFETILFTSEWSLSSPIQVFIDHTTLKATVFSPTDN